MGNILWIIILYFVFPALFLSVEHRVKVISFLSPAFFCYLTGIILGNIAPSFIPSELTHTIISASVLIAIPLLLFSSNLKTWLSLAPHFALSYCLYLFAIMLMVWISANVFQSSVSAIHKIIGMAAGVYIGGTANLAAIGTALDVPDQLFIQLNLIDLALSGMYLLFLLTVAQRILLSFLSSFTVPISHSPEHFTDINIQPNKHSDSYSPEKYLNIGKGIGCSIIIVGISVGASFLIYGNTNEIFILISLTLLALAASMIPFIHKIPNTYHTGQYLFLVFCLATGALVDLQTITEGSLQYAAIMATIVYGSLILHILLCFLFKIDADTALTTSTAGIFGPPFIGPLAQALKNRHIVASGMILGIIGLAIGNIVGIAISWWLS